jgi:hypothetical protein
METGIPVSAWWEEEEAALATALEVMAEERERSKDGRARRHDDDGRVTGG